MSRLVCRALLGVTLLFAGCGTLTQGHMVSGPAAAGGVRLDLAIIGDENVPIMSKVQAAIDIPFSFALDVGLLLPFSLWNELIAGGIDVEAPIHWDNPPPKKAPYSAPSERDIPGQTIKAPDDRRGI